MANNAIRPLDERSISLFGFDVGDSTNISAILPPVEVVKKQSYRSKALLMRALLEICPEVAAVWSVFSAQIAAHVLDVTGKNTRQRFLDLFRETDEGDGWRAFARRLSRDLMCAGWCVAGNEYDGARLVDVYHIDAINCSMNLGRDASYPRRQFPLVYRSRETQPIYLERGDTFTESWWIMAMPRSKDELRSSNGVMPSMIPLFGVYDDIRSICIGRAVKQAAESGDAVLKLVFTNAQPNVIRDSERTARVERSGDLNNGVNMYAQSVMDTLFVHTLEPASLNQVGVRTPPTEAELESRSQSLKIKLCNVFGLNPMDVDSRLSGAGGLNDGTKAKVADDLRSGRLVAEFMKALTENINTWVLPRTLQASFSFNDPRDEQRRIANKKLLVETYSEALTNGVLDKRQVDLDASWEEVFAPNVIQVESDVQTTTVLENTAATKSDADEQSDDGLAKNIADDDDIVVEYEYV